MDRGCAVWYGQVLLSLHSLIKWGMDRAVRRVHNIRSLTSHTRLTEAFDRIFGLVTHGKPFSTAHTTRDGNGEITGALIYLWSTISWQVEVSYWMV